MPEHGEEGYSMSAAAKAQRSSNTEAAKVASLPNRVLLVPARAPACEFQENAAVAAANEPQEKGRASHRLTNSGSKPPPDTPAGSDRQTVAAAETPIAKPRRDSGSPAGELEVRIALEYERACYKQAEAKVRARLNKLQQAVNERSNRKSVVQSASLESGSP
jgi:hypothetical protein